MDHFQTNMLPCQSTKISSRGPSRPRPPLPLFPIKSILASVRDWAELIINWINHTDYVRSKIARWYVRGRIFWRIHKQPDVRRTPWGSFVGVLKQFSDVYYGRTPLSAGPGYGKHNILFGPRGKYYWRGKFTKPKGPINGIFYIEKTKPGTTWCTCSFLIFKKLFKPSSYRRYLWVYIVCQDPTFWKCHNLYTY